MAGIKRALISVSDKTGIVELAKVLSKKDIEVISTGGTANLLSDNGINVIEASYVTGFPEMMEGRIKTLHPKIHGGVLARRDNPDDMSQLEEQDITPIDLVVVNLYPFKQTISNPKVTLNQAIEQIDIGGPTLIRAAAKNYRDVAVVVNAARYEQVAKEIEEDGVVSAELKSTLAVEAFQHTAYYDSLIASYLHDKLEHDDTFPSSLTLGFEKSYDLRYGENPYQKAAFYHDPQLFESGVANAKLVNGKPLSYNNILDLNDAFELVKDFERPTAAVIKHTNPCGVASADNIQEAYRKAHEADPMAAFGCIIAANRKIDLASAELMKDFFIEAIIAPGYDDDALELLKTKEKRRILISDGVSKTDQGYDIKRVVGGVLVQTRTFPGISADNLKVVTKRKPTQEEIESMIFAWKVCKHVKSNSIVYAKDEMSVAVGAGQMSRVDSVKICNFKAGEKAKGAVMASDAFFPFRDGIDEAASAGVSAAIQPGGSIRDAEVTEAANELGLAMVYTGHRIFKH